MLPTWPIYCASAHGEQKWANGIAPQAKVNASTSGSVLIDSRPGEAFKPVFLSSMRVSDTQWDARAAVVDG